MPQSLKQIKNRIRSVENSKKVTNAMQMISVAKLNRAENELFGLRPYALKLESVMYNLAASAQDPHTGYFGTGVKGGYAVLCAITSDNGLCGVYNQNVFHACEKFINDHGADKVRLILIGQKGLNYFKPRPVKVVGSYTGLNARFSGRVCGEILDRVKGSFLAGEAASVHLAYTYFENSIVQRPRIDRLLGIETRKIKPLDYIAEPDLKSILDDLIPRYLEVKLQMAFLESFTSEHAARTISMKTATDNAKELISGLVLLRNKLRQAGITQDILEITSSVEALKG